MMERGRLLTSGMVLLLCGCGGGSSDDEVDAGSHSESTNSSSDGDSTDSTDTTSESTATESTTGEPEQPPFDYCDGLPPDDECYAAKRDPTSEAVMLAMALADRHMALHPPTEQAWDWEEAVFMFSLTELHRVTGAARFQDHYRAWIDHHIEQGYLIETSDTCSPVATAAALYRETGDDKYDAVWADAQAYFDAANRTNAGGLSHFGTFPLAATLWADSLFMFGNVLTRWGEVHDEQANFDELALQFAVFGEALHSDGGLFAHAWNFPTADPTVYWGRGNGWITAAGYDYLRALRIRDQTDDATATMLAAQVDAILANQDPSGAWWIIVDRPDEIYLETSTTALFAYGLARGFRYGHLTAEQVMPAIDAAMQAIDGSIAVDGEGLPYVTGVSGPTGPGSVEDYATIPLVDDIGYGVGAVILSLVETSGLP